jgi:DNA-binding GntR family transcriptional regulator
MSTIPHQQAIMRLHAEFTEMPGMRLSLEQVRRLCGIDRSVCQSALADLVKSGVLVVATDGAFLRASERSTIRVPRSRL